MPPFASTADLGTYLEETLAGTRLARAALVLDMVTARIKGWTRQDIELVTDDVVTLAGTYDWELRLPQRPVVEVSAVTVDGAAVGSGSYRLAGGVLVQPGGWSGPAAAVEVTYTHGYDPIPPDVWAVTLALAAREMATPAGVAQEAIGSYSVTYDDDPASEALLSTLRGYRRSSGSVPIVAAHGPVAFPYPVANA